MADNLKQIQELNDRLRTTGWGGRTCYTKKLYESSISALVVRTIKAIKGLKGLHDYGVVVVNDLEFCFRITYIDDRYKHVNSLTETNRIITIGFKEEFLDGG